MKAELPDGHGLSADICESLIFREGGAPSLSDVQHLAVQGGIGRGRSMLVVSPTSTGKTQIGLWAIASALQSGDRAVYLVTHRALAKQKFDDFRETLLQKFLGGDGSALIVATGDSVEDAEGTPRSDPLRARLLIATYEKYLGLISAAGIPEDMTSVTVVCDEIQLIGDPHRGQQVEVLLTLLRKAGWKQLVGLSAILRSSDAQELADWLGVTLVHCDTREKHLQYECWTTNGIARVRSDSPDQVEEGVALPSGAGDLQTISILLALLRENNPPTPIIVFCMRKADTYALANSFLQTRPALPKGQLSLAFDGLPETTANGLLAQSFEHNAAVHNADLTDEERHIVERQLLDGKLDVVFATGTLSAGVNFPFGAALFASWSRWDRSRRESVPIDPGEFHNSAGRVGRMGFSHTHGRVVFTARGAGDTRQARAYLDLAARPNLESRVSPRIFPQLCLQLVASGLGPERASVREIICETLSAQREQDRNARGLSQWHDGIEAATNSLMEEGLVLETSAGRLSATPVGRAIGQSGLMPSTGVYLLNYLSQKAERLSRLLPTETSEGQVGDLAFLVFAACLSSPEFRPTAGNPPTRALPFPLDAEAIFSPDKYRDDLAEPVWHADVAPINGAKLATEWIEGAELRNLEKTLPQLSAGMLGDLFRNLSWVLQGVAAISNAAADSRVPTESRPLALRHRPVDLRVMGRLPRVIRRLARRVLEGLPDDSLWLSQVATPESPFRLSRTEILVLRLSGHNKPEVAMLGSKEADEVRARAFSRARPSPIAKANWFRDACRDWKARERKRAAQHQLRRARRCQHIEIGKRYYASKGAEFHDTFEAVLTLLKIRFERLDDGTIAGAPDYLIGLDGSPSLVVELKSKQGDKLVDYNRAVEVLAASEVHGHKDAFCVTICHPGVDPSVPLVVSGCGRLSVVESHDLGEGLLRLCEGVLTQSQLWQWLATPGQALASDLPFREF